jgi:hypothetical protein
LEAYFSIFSDVFVFFGWVLILPHFYSGYCTEY